jgi:hypothetical protein
MQNIIDRITNLTISSEIKTALLRDLFATLIGTVGLVIPERFTSNDAIFLKELAEKNEHQKIAEELQKHFSDEEWNTLVIPKINSLIESYEEEVLATVA